MRRQPVRAIFGFLAPAVAIAVFVVLLAFSLTHLKQVERNLRIDATTNMLWVLSQTQVASQRLGRTVARAELGRVKREEVRMRYDLLMGRLNLLDAGPQRRRMAALGFEKELDELIEAAQSLEPLIENAQPEDLADAARILDPMDGFLARATNDAMLAEWDDLSDLLDQHREQLWYVIVSLVGITAAVLVLSGFLLYSYVMAQRRMTLLDRERNFSGLLVSSSDEGILAVDRDLRCTAWNSAAEKLFGWTAERAAGRTLGEISGFFELPDIAGAFDRGLDDEPAALTDRLFFRPDALSEAYVDMSCFPLKEDDGQVLGVIAFVRDVTDRHAAQEELVRHRDHLEEQVELRTRELSEALEREREVSALYRNFAAMVSHQFRTPMAIIDSTLQRLIRRRAQVTQNEITARAQKAREAVARLVRLVESTLDAARLDAGQIEINSAEHDLFTLADAVCECQREATPDREIILDAPAPPLSVVCDSTHAEHALVNLVGNAVKYSPPATPVMIELGTSTTHAFCRVSNAGDGIPPTEQEKVFARYFRGANASGKTGTGVGLFMARTLVQMQGGNVELVQSCPGRTVFMLSLPFPMQSEARRSEQPCYVHSERAP